MCVGVCACVECVMCVCGWVCMCEMCVACVCMHACVWGVYAHTHTYIQVSTA